MSEIHNSALHKLAYLQALGVPTYVSRRQARGAAPSRRLVQVRAEQAAPPGAVSRLPPGSRESTRVEKSAPPRRKAGDSPVRPAAAQAVEPADACNFSLVTLFAGEWLWLENLGEMPLTSDQVQLVQAVAHALAFRGGVDGVAGPPGTVAPQVSTFKWPLHSNRQLDSGLDAARASLAAFLGRRIEELGCAGIVLLGDECAHWVETSRLQVPAVTIPGTARMLRDPDLKRHAWRALQPLRTGVAARGERA